MRARATCRPLRTACLTIALCVSSAGLAHAQPAASAAELLDAEGTALMQEHRYAEACPKLERSDRLQPGTGVLLRLGLCYQLSGKTASAWTAFHEAAGRARRAGDDPIAQLATKRAAAIEPRLAIVTLRLARSADLERVEVRCDGVVLERSAIGAPLPMDPGAHSVRASIPGRPPFVRSFVVADGDAPVTIGIDLGAEPIARPASQPDAGSPTARRSTQRTLALVSGGVGIAGATVGTIFGLSALSSWNRAKSECKSGFSGCSSDALGRQSTVSRDAAWSTTGFVIGAAGIVGAAVLWWTAPSLAPTDRAGYAVAPAVEGRRLGVAVSGRF